jgi:galactokinase
MAASIAVFAPGRVNLIGEHTDYSGGLVLPVAIGFGITVLGDASPDRIVLESAALPGGVELAPDGARAGPVPGWGRYVAAVAALLAERGRPPVGLEGTVASTLPIGAGLSSSAALDVAVALALCRVAGFELPPLELARVAQQAELRAVGVPCGLMDPAVSLLGRSGRALLLDCGTEARRLVPLPEGLAMVVLDSGIRHALEDSGYAQRRAELERGLAALGGKRPADVTTDEAAAAARDVGIDDVAARRLRHVVSENERVRELVAALEAPGGPELGRVGAIMRAGHESLRDDFEVSLPELDLLVELAYASGAIGARLTGGGFGGSVVALADEAGAATLVAAVERSYRARTGRAGVGYVCASADGAGDVPVETR